MRFADPVLFALLLVIPAVLLLRRLLRQDDSAPGTFSSLALLAGYRPTWRVRFRWLPTALRGLALVLLVIALARPQTGQARSQLPGQGIDIALVLDTSSSMTIGFGGETRASAAEQVLTEFIDGRSDDRLGLVIFRDESLVLSPLTLDLDALKRLVSEAQQVNLNDGTAIGLGLAEAVSLLRESRARSRVAILLTDGQNNNRTIEPLAAARIAETLGIRVYTIGVLETTSRGTTGANVDERALREMAEVTGGSYFSADSPDTLAAVYDNIDRLEKSRVGRIQYLTYNELAVYLLAAALALLVFEQALRAFVWRRAN
jgi:Ca-activated chloride channel homolog